MGGPPDAYPRSGRRRHDVRAFGLLAAGDPSRDGGPDAGSRDRAAGTDDLVARFRADETSEGSSAREPAAQERVAAARALAAEFRDFRRGQTLGGLDPKALIREGLR